MYEKCRRIIPFPAKKPKKFWEGTFCGNGLPKDGKAPSQDTTPFRTPNPKMDLSYINASPAKLLKTPMRITMTNGLC